MKKVNCWRMAFRWGSEGYEMSPYCFDHKVASIGYWYNGKPVVGDCSNMTPDEFDQEWPAQLSHSGSAKSSLRKFRFDMKQGDVIYVKRGKSIVCKGIIKSDYWYDPDLYSELRPKFRWMHHRRVDWDLSYPAVPIVLGADLHTILKLNPTRLRAIQSAELRTGASERQLSAKEGQELTSERTFRQRNQALIEAKKANSDYRCEVCGLKFEELYGDIGREHIVAHHLKPIGGRRRALATKLKDIALVCANCHDMLHKREPPLAVAALASRLRKHASKGRWLSLQMMELRKR